MLQYNTLTLTESAQIVAFLTDLHPSHLLLTLPAPQNPKAPSEANIKAAHLRYRMSFFVDTYFTKINPLMFKLVGADHGPSQEKIVDEILGLLEKEIEPLLFDTGVDEGGRSGGGKYFTGSERITFVEVRKSSPISQLLSRHSFPPLPSTLPSRKLTFLPQRQ